MTDPLLFVLAVLTVTGIPGPTNTLLMMSGATVGIARSMPLLAAEITAYNLSILAVGILLRPWIDDVPLVRVALRVVAAAYLVMLALEIWRARTAKDRAPVTLRHLFVTTLLNPKVFIFALIVVPLQAPNASVYLVGFSMIVVLVGALWIAFGALAGGVATGGYTALVPKAAAVALGGFAAWLIVSPFIG
jgi:threonine/homoserine/homoserine lactone efflux protein